MVMSLGKGATYTASNKQKTQHKKLNGGQIVAVDNEMEQVLYGQDTS